MINTNILSEKLTPFNFNYDSTNINLNYIFNGCNNKKRIVLFHYPIIDWNGKYYGSIHLFGHTHNMQNEDTNYMEKQKNCYNVGFDIWKDLVSIEEFGVKL